MPAPRLLRAAVVVVATLVLTVVVLLVRPWASASAPDVHGQQPAPARGTVSSGDVEGAARRAAVEDAFSRASTRVPVDEAVLEAEAAARAETLREVDERLTADLERARREAERAGYDPDLTDPRQIARQLAASRHGWDGEQWGCIDALITQESSWDPLAVNPGSGAYGLVQALPAEKLATAGDDWRTNPATQLRWGFDYIEQRYSTPCRAWSFHRAHNWY
ncbi:aggregation-promoting factor C-terminal-like domain-containing protein [Desertihabitans aurantiacus]|uniref:aggregation-promoting factor C-terminal-like domain-containing protein n=1 Tax=Desertihabitans aurantiacus TaxID=2282477 RepID=UPI0018E4E53A|nr:transglycosylase SLT domain-containing protein [Desertihabitans aurantiacus]